MLSQSHADGVRDRSTVEKEKKRSAGRSQYHTVVLARQVTVYVGQVRWVPHGQRAMGIVRSGKKGWVESPFVLRCTAVVPTLEFILFATVIVQAFPQSKHQG